MTKITKENYLKFLTYHGRDPEVAKWVVKNYHNTDAYHKIGSVRIWVDASLMVLNEFKS
jgi:hypothetical protein